MSSAVVKSLEQEIAAYLQYCLLDKNLQHSTIALYRYYLQEFLSWGRIQYSLLYPADLTRELIHEYRVYLTKKSNSSGPLKRSTQNYFLIAIRGFLRFLAAKGISALPADQVILGKVRDRAVKFLQASHIEALLNSPDTSTIEGVRDKAILELLFTTGLRVSEAVSLNRDQVNLKQREFGVLGKGGKIRVVFLSRVAAINLEAYLSLRTDSYKPLFIRHRGGVSIENKGERMRLTVRTIERLVGKYGRKATLPFRISPHVLRHSFATDLLMNGADLRSVQELLGHANVSTTQIYTHVTNPHLRDVHDAFHGRFREREVNE